MPVPTTQPQRSADSGVGRMPASRNACSAAASANRCARLANFSSLRSPITRSASKSLTSAAIRVEKPLASKPRIGAAALRPASSASQVVATSLPAGVTMPIPVIATRRRGSVITWLRSMSMRAVAIVRPSARAASFICAPSADDDFMSASSSSVCPGAVNERIFTSRTRATASRLPCSAGRSPASCSASVERLSISSVPGKTGRRGKWSSK